METFANHDIIEELARLDTRNYRDFSSQANPGDDNFLSDYDQDSLVINRLQESYRDSVLRKMVLLRTGFCLLRVLFLLCFVMLDDWKINPFLEPIVNILIIHEIIIISNFLLYASSSFVKRFQNSFNAFLWQQNRRHLRQQQNELSINQDNQNNNQEEENQEREEDNVQEPLNANHNQESASFNQEAQNQQRQQQPRPQSERNENSLYHGNFQSRYRENTHRITVLNNMSDERRRPMNIPENVSENVAENLRQQLISTDANIMRKAVRIIDYSANIIFFLWFMFANYKFLWVKDDVEGSLDTNTFLTYYITLLILIGYFCYSRLIFTLIFVVIFGPCILFVMIDKYLKEKQRENRAQVRSFYWLLENKRVFS